MNYSRSKKILISMALMCVLALPVAMTATSSVYAQGQGVYGDIAQCGWGCRPYWGGGFQRNVWFGGGGWYGRPGWGPRPVFWGHRGWHGHRWHRGFRHNIWF